MFVGRVFPFPPKLVNPRKIMQDEQEKTPINNAYPMQKIAVK
jgi:hypothetical protein